jgi:hypothetical protein
MEMQLFGHGHELAKQAQVDHLGAGSGNLPRVRRQLRASTLARAMAGHCSATDSMLSAVTAQIPRVRHMLGVLQAQCMELPVAGTQGPPSLPAARGCQIGHALRNGFRVQLVGLAFDAPHASSPPAKPR